MRKCSKEGKEAGAKANETAAPKIKGKPGRKPKAKPGEARVGRNELPSKVVSQIFLSSCQMKLKPTRPLV